VLNRRLAWLTFRAFSQRLDLRRNVTIAIKSVISVTVKVTIATEIITIKIPIGDLIMAGSKQWCSYKNDQNTFYAIERDESNSRATIKVVGGAAGTELKLFEAAATPFVGTKPPQGFKGRYVNSYLSTDPVVKRQFPVGNPLAYAVALAGNAQISAPLKGGTGEAVLVWNVTTSRPELTSRTFNFTADTGQTDGTTTAVGA
jgi:hypothetical protein